MTIQNVTIGDQFISNQDKKSKRVSKVVDFIENKSMVTGVITGYTCIAEKETLGQAILFETPFSTVIRNKVK